MRGIRQGGCSGTCSRHTPSPLCPLPLPPPAVQMEQAEGAPPCPLHAQYTARTPSSLAPPLDHRRLPAHTFDCSQHLLLVLLVVQPDNAVAAAGIAALLPLQSDSPACCRVAPAGVGCSSKVDSRTHWLCWHQGRRGAAAAVVGWYVRLGSNCLCG
jgi:hypothetical protein